MEKHTDKIIIEFNKEDYKKNVCSQCSKRKSCNQNTLRVFICGYENKQWFIERSFKTRSRNENRN